MEVLILSKTRIGPDACVGGIVLDGFTPVRLLNGINKYQPINTDFVIGDVWDIEFKNIPDRPPHTEDVMILKKHRIRNLNVREFIIANRGENGVQIWEGPPHNMFGGCLKFIDARSAYIATDNVPVNSIGFWLLNSDLELRTTNWFGKIKHRYHNAEIDMSYVGFADPLPTIPAGTLLRVSLAKWFKPGNNPEGCYLQLSGWYL